MLDSRTITQPKILIGFETCDLPKYQARQKQCLDSWARQLPENYHLLIATGRMMNVPDDYYHLSQKTQAICKYALAGDYDWCVIVDDDTVIRMEQFKPPEADYAGRIVPPSGDKPHEYIQGGCYWLSRKAYTLIAEAEIDDPTEDRWVGGVLLGHGIKPLDLPDFVKAPCQCGNPLCVPDPVPENWTVMLQILDGKPFAQARPMRIIPSV